MARSFPGRAIQHDLPGTKDWLLRGFSEEHKLATAILAMGGLAAAGIDRSVFSEADGIDAIGSNAQAGEFFADGQGATLAKGTVILIGPTFVTMSFHEHGIGGI